MSLVPRVRQPDPVACFPTCVWAVLTFQRQDVEYEEVFEACVMDAYGALDPIALQGLQEAGWDVEVLREFDPETVLNALEEERPLIVSLPQACVGEHLLYHAVVICELAEDAAVVMDPAVGEYVSVPLSDPRLNGGQNLAGGFFIGGTAVCGPIPPATPSK